MSCLQIDCEVNWLDSYMFRRFRDLGKEYGINEQKVTEAIMRSHMLVAKHYVENRNIDKRTVGPNFWDYEFILSREEINEFASLKFDS